MSNLPFLLLLVSFGALWIYIWIYARIINLYLLCHLIQNLRSAYTDYGTCFLYQWKLFNTVTERNKRLYILNRPYSTGGPQPQLIQSQILQPGWTFTGLK